MPDNWSLIQVTSASLAQPTAAIQASDGAIFQAPGEMSDMPLMAVLGEWERWAPRLHDLELNSLPELENVITVAPLTYPHKVICAGANFYSHAEEMGTARPDPNADPFFFLKPPTTTVVGPDAEIAIISRVDWEIELGVVISSRIHDVNEAQALDAVAGYVVANDISDRDSFRRQGSVFPAFDFDWLAHKGQDGFCPVGPGIVPSWLVEDPQALDMRLSINDVVKQQSSTGDMVVGVARLIAAASRTMTLEPGDLILTGTPAGVGMAKGEYLTPGDTVTATIEGIGTLTNRMVKK